MHSYVEGDTWADQAGARPRSLATPEALRATASDRSQKAAGWALARAAAPPSIIGAPGSDFIDRQDHCILRRLAR
jgi:hypothetical protein